MKYEFKLPEGAIISIGSTEFTYVGDGIVRSRGVKPLPALMELELPDQTPISDITALPSPERAIDINSYRHVAMIRHE